MRLQTGAIVVSIVALVVVVLVAGITDGFGTGTQLQASVPGSLPDGAAADTFWDSQLVDIPGVSATGVHCHCSVKYELQVGATGPSHDNPCYAAMGLYSGNGTQWGVYITLPGDRAVYRISEEYQPWRYCIAGLISGSAESGTEPPSLPC
ncbi:MAG: hypothetical protein ACXVBB_18430 [Isosphaeraceae bacterium]